MLMTDGLNAYASSSTVGEVPRVLVHHFGRGMKHSNTKNCTHSHLKKFMEQFNGVATKYLDKFLARILHSMA